MKNQVQQTIQKVEEAYFSFGVDSLTCQIAQQDLRLQIMEYLDKKDIKNDCRGISTQKSHSPKDESIKQMEVKQNG